MEAHDGGSQFDAAISPEFGPTHIINPLEGHIFTAVLLHGRGSTGEEFANDLFESKLSSGKSLREEFPEIRWVFPSSKILFSTTFQEHMPAWFEAYSLTDTTARQDLQVEGITESVAHVCSIIDDEVKLLAGKLENLVLGGISQGGAITLWSLLCHGRGEEQRLGAVIGTNTWLPFEANIRTALSQQPLSSKTGEDQEDQGGSDFDAFVTKMMAPVRRILDQRNKRGALLGTPIFIGHGADDAYVDVTLGREAASVLSSIGLRVQWTEYTGAEEEGHWLKIPEELDDIRDFLRNALA